MRLIAPVVRSNTVMDKLLRVVFGLFISLAFGQVSFGQHLIKVPVRRSLVERQEIRQQRQAAPGRKLEVVKENYIGARLRLTQDEGRAFWPLYRQYVQDRTAVRIAQRQNMSDLSINSAEQLNRNLAYDTQLLNIKKYYQTEFLKILPPNKVYELNKSEKDFNEEVVKQLGERPANK
jgi:hypothetical protein